MPARKRRFPRLAANSERHEGTLATCTKLNTYELLMHAHMHAIAHTSFSAKGLTAMMRAQENIIDSTTIVVTVNMCYYDYVDLCGTVSNL